MLYAEFLSGIIDHPIELAVPDIDAGLETAQKSAKNSIVLLKNQNAILPLITDYVHSIAVIGGHADVGMISGGGSAQVDPPGGNAIMPPGPLGATHWQDHVWFPTSPLKALRAQLPSTKIEFESGEDIEAAEIWLKNRCRNCFRVPVVRPRAWIFQISRCPTIRTIDQTRCRPIHAQSLFLRPGPL